MSTTDLDGKLHLFNRAFYDPKTAEQVDFYLQERPFGKDETIQRLAISYDEKPVDIEEFIKSDRYLNLANVVRPEVMADLKAMFNAHDRFMHCSYEEAVFDEAIGSGKSFKSSVIICYGLHHLLCLKEPQKYFGLDPTTLIAVMNMSINATQAKKVVFGEIRTKIENSRWFKRWHLDPNVRSELRFEKNITVFPGHSGAMYPQGFNVIMAVMDEAAFYPETEGVRGDVAQEMFYAIKGRIKSRYRHLGGLVIMISSPRYVDDFIERKMKEAQEKPDKILSRRRAIWEVLEGDKADIEQGKYFVLAHPMIQTPTKIPLKYQEDFTVNPEKAWRDFGAVPSLVLEPYIKQFDLVLARVDSNLASGLDENGRPRQGFAPIPGAAYYIHVDLAIRRDACGFAMAHKTKDGVVVDIIHRIVGSPTKEIDISEVKGIVLALKQRGFRIGKVTFDQFQSAQSIQELKRQNIEADLLSVDSSLAAYDTLKEMCYTGKVRYPHHQQFLDEMQRLELIQGKKVDHSPKGSKDVSDAVAGAVYNAVQGVMTREARVTIVG